MKTIRHDFPILNQTVNGQELLYFDSAATSQKPQYVIDSLVNYYQNNNANVHRGIYELSERATQQYEQARDKVQKFIHAQKREEVLFTRGTTESLNWLASTYGAENVKQGDEILISYMEHHSNIAVSYTHLIVFSSSPLGLITPVTTDVSDLFQASKRSVQCCLVQFVLLTG